MSGRNAAAAAAAAAVFAAIPAAAVAGPSPPLQPTARGAALALSLLLRRADVGRGWSPVPAVRTPSPIACSGLRPNESRLLETGLSSATYTNYRWDNVWDTVRIFASASDARQLFPERAIHALIACSKEQLVQAVERFKRLTRLRFPHVATSVDAFRIVATMTRGPAIGRSSALVLPVYTDIALIERGRAEEVVVFGSLADTPNRSLEEHVLRLLSGRLRSSRVS